MISMKYLLKSINKIKNDEKYMDSGIIIGLNIFTYLRFSSLFNYYDSKFHLRF